MKNPVFLRNVLWAAVVVAIGVLLYLRFPMAEPKQENAPVFLHATMTIKRADGKTYPFDIEVAATTEQQMYGLMFRRSLPQNAGMIFVYDSDQIIRMWMKNTYIPLDMLFVRQDGTIAKIITHAVPFDLTPLSSGEPVRAVVEINDGAAEQMGLQTGDKIIYPPLTGQP